MSGNCGSTARGSISCHYPSRCTRSQVRQRVLKLVVSTHYGHRIKNLSELLKIQSSLYSRSGKSTRVSSVGPFKFGTW